MKSTTSPRDILRWGKDVLQEESAALERASKKLDQNFCDAVDIVLNIKGRVICTGLGKSGHIARKLAATLSSTGTPANFLHPAEALHGDLGTLQGGDVLVAIAYGGETTEVIAVAQTARRRGVPIIGISAKKESTLGALANVWLDGSVEKEACPNNLAPTSSTTLAMALGDAIAVATMRLRGFTAEDFAQNHPGGLLGKRLSLVKDHMHPSHSLATLTPKQDFHAALMAITKNNFGIAAVVDERQRLLGAISDGDVRRALMNQGAEALHKSVEALMKPAPKTILGTRLALDALQKMEQNKITSLFVIAQEEERPELVGLVRMHDLLAAKIV